MDAASTEGHCCAEGLACQNRCPIEVALELWVELSLFSFFLQEMDLSSQQMCVLALTLVYKSSADELPGPASVQCCVEVRDPVRIKITC